MKVGFLGTGLMGNPMAKRILTETDHQLTVYNRTISKTENLEAAGAKVEAEAKDVIANNDVLISMLTAYPQTEEVYFSDDIDFTGKTIIQMGTITPDENVKLADKFESLGAEYLEAPVLASIPQASEGELFILVGGKKDLAEKFDSLLAVMGHEIIYFGEVGKASAAKLALNQLIVTLTSAFSMSLGYLREKEVDVEKFMGILRSSALYAPTFDKKLDKMLTRDFTNPNFPVKHLVKDVDLITAQFGESGLDVSILNGIQQILKRSMDTGDADMDYSALYNSIHPKSR